MNDIKFENENRNWAKQTITNRKYVILKIAFAIFLTAFYLSELSTADFTLVQQGFHEQSRRLQATSGNSSGNKNQQNRAAAGRIHNRRKH